MSKQEVHRREWEKLFLKHFVPHCGPENCGFEIALTQRKRSSLLYSATDHLVSCGDSGVFSGEDWRLTPVCKRWRWGLVETITLGKQELKGAEAAAASPQTSPGLVYESMRCLLGSPRTGRVEFMEGAKFWVDWGWRESGKSLRSLCLLCYCFLVLPLFTQAAEVWNLLLHLFLRRSLGIYGGCNGLFQMFQKL